MKMNITNKESLIVEFQISNFKSYFNEPIKLELTKPITIIAGPNGEGKTNLLEAMLIGLANFLYKSYKFRRNSLFTKEIKISSNPEIKANLYQLIFTDLIKKSLAKRPSEISFPERLDPKNILSYEKKKGEILVHISKCSDRGSSRLGEIQTSITTSAPYIENKEYYRNQRFECFELLYLNPAILDEFFVKLTGQEFLDQVAPISTLGRMGQYKEKILNIFPNEKNRLICDMSRKDGKFEEKYSEGKNLFLTSNLATGAKKECMLYILALIAEKHKGKKDWLTIFLIDEIEEGLHANKQKELIEVLIKAFREREEFKKNIKIVMTTHSPIIYSELMKYPEYVDTYFALRNPKESSKIFRWDSVVEDELLEKRVLTELGLSIYEWPQKVVFVEGPTDKLFFGKVLEDVGITPRYGANIPKILQDLIASFPLSRLKEYFVVTDKGEHEGVEEKISRIKEKGINVEALDLGFGSLEELIFDIDLDSEEIAIIWGKIEKRLEEFKKKVEEAEKRILEINVKEAREKLEEKDKEGLKIFFQTSVKKRNDFYELMGSKCDLLLKNKAKNQIAKIKKTIEK